jgi:hypothetical protein
MYEDSPDNLLRSVVSTVKDGGLVSTLLPNPGASAVRSAVRGRWKEALASVEAGREMGEMYLPTSEPSLDDVRLMSLEAGAEPVEWYGVGVFSEVCSGPIARDDFDDFLELEWQAGMREPYRSIARCFHLISRRPTTQRVRTSHV